MRDVIATMIPNYNKKSRYKITGEYDSESKIMYFDMATAEESSYRSATKE